MPRRLAVALLVALAAAGLASPAGAPAAAKRCGTVDLALRDDPLSKARGIRASGTSCRVARRVAKASDDDPFAPSYRARRFTCTGVEEYGAYYAMHYTCRRGDARIRFRVSAA